MGRGLIGQHVGIDAAAHQLRQHRGGIAEQADRERLALVLRLAQPAESLVQVVGGPVEVAGLQAAFDAGRVDLDAQESGPVHGGGQRLSPAHAAQAGTDHQPAGQGAGEVSARPQAAKVS